MVGPRGGTLSRGEPTFLSPPDRPAAGLGPERKPSAFEAASLPRLHSSGISSTTDCGFWPGQSGPSRGLTTGHTPRGEAATAERYSRWMLPPGTRLAASALTMALSLFTSLLCLRGQGFLGHWDYPPLTLLLCKLGKQVHPHPNHPISCLVVAMEIAALCSSLGLGVVKNCWG